MNRGAWEWMMASKPKYIIIQLLFQKYKGTISGMLTDIVSKHKQLTFIENAAGETSHGPDKSFRTKRGRSIPSPDSKIGMNSNISLQLMLTRVILRIYIL